MSIESRSILGVIDEVARQRALDALDILDTPAEERFDRVTRLARQLFGVEAAAISLIDRDRDWYKSRSGFDLPEIPRALAICDVTIGQSETLIYRDLRGEELFKDNPFVHDDPGMRFYAGHPLVAAGGEPIGTFCIFDPSPREFTDSEKALLRDLALWVQNELTVAEELDRAAEVQRGLLPKRMVHMPGYDLAGACRPARAVGGDFYDWYPVQEGAALTVADVMGKGIGSAIIAATVRAVLRSGAARQDLRATVDTAALTLQSDLDEAATFVTLFHARLDSESGRVRFIDAGHGLTAVVHPERGFTRLESTNLPLGLGFEESWVEQSVELQPGDTLVSVSDGLLDALGGSLESLRDLEEIVRRSVSAEQVVQALQARGRGADDDVTVVALRRN